MASEIIERLSKTDLFSQLPHKHLKRVAGLVETRQVSKGEVLVREGTFSREFFLILDGAADVTVRSKRRDQLGKGEFFGELAILGHTARAATVTAATDMTVAVLGAKDFQALVESEPKIALYLLDVLIRRFEHVSYKPRGELK